jgi:hypothetical protein
MRARLARSESHRRAACRFAAICLLLQNALPDFFFHVATAYAILRHCAVDVGKKDFIGQF